MKHIIVLILLTSLVIACNKKEKADVEASDTEMVKNEPNKGIGPITDIELSDEIDQAMVEKGEEIYKSFCIACHATDKKEIGPALTGVTERRTPEWIMNMLLNTHEMLYKDSDAKKLLEEHDNIAMAPSDMTEADARNVLEWLRTIK